MHSLRNTLIGTAILALGSTACVDAGKSFKEFDNRVFDAAPAAIGGCNGGEIPDVSGEFYLGLSPVIAPSAILELIVSTEINRTLEPAILSLSMQPLCTQSDQCTVGQPVGDPFTLDDAEVDENCNYKIVLTDVFIPGGANSISGSDIIGNLELLGSLPDADFYCGIVNGTATVGGAAIPIDNSTFGAQRIVEGTLGADLPEPIGACPEETPDVDAGVADAGPTADAML